MHLKLNDSKFDLLVFKILCMLEILIAGTSDSKLYVTFISVLVAHS